MRAIKKMVDKWKTGVVPDRLRHSLADEAMEELIAMQSALDAAFAALEVPVQTWKDMGKPIGGSFSVPSRYIAAWDAQIEALKETNESRKA